MDQSVGESEQGGVPQRHEGDGGKCDRKRSGLAEDRHGEAGERGGGTKVERAAFGADPEEMQRPEEGASARGPHEKPVLFGADPQDVPRVEGHQDHEIGRDKQGDLGDQKEHGRAGRVRSDMAEPLQDSSVFPGTGFARLATGWRQRGKGDEQGKKTGGIRVESGRGSEAGDEPAADGRPGQPGGMEHRPVDGHCMPDLVFTHQFRHQSRRGGHFKRGGDAKTDSGESHMPYGDVPGGHPGSQPHRHRRLKQHHGSEQNAFVDAIRHGACPEAQEKHGRAGDEVDRAECECGGGEPGQDPALRGLLDPCAEHRNGFPGHVPQKWAAQGAGRVRFEFHRVGAERGFGLLPDFQNPVERGRMKTR